MLKGFEEYTAPLDEYEQKVLLPLLIQGLKTKVGKENAITNPAIVSKLKEKGYKIEEPRVRKLISYIRINDLIPLLIASSKGYWISNNHKEIEDWIETAQGRINALVASSEALKRQFKKIKSESTDLEKDLGIEVCKCSSPDSVPVNDELSVCLSCGLNIN